MIGLLRRRVQSPSVKTDCGKEADGPVECIRKLEHILVGVYGSHCEGMMANLLEAISASMVNAQRFVGYIPLITLYG